MIVVDASAMTEFLRQTPLGSRVEVRLLRDADEFRPVRGDPLSRSRQSSAPTAIKPGSRRIVLVGPWRLSGTHSAGATALSPVLFIADPTAD